VNGKTLFTHTAIGGGLAVELCQPSMPDWRARCLNLAVNTGVLHAIYSGDLCLAQDELPVFRPTPLIVARAYD